MRFTFEVRDKATGVGISGAPAVIKRQSDGAPLASLSADASGLVTYQVDGSPGDVYAEVTIGTEVKRYSSRPTGPSGFVQIGELSDLLRSLLPGVVQGVDAGLVVHSTGTSNMSVTVGSGLALLQNVTYRQYTNPKTLALGTADVTNPRIDLIVARGDRATGVTTLAVKAGTPAASPVAPTVTQSAALWEEALAQVRVEAGTLTVDEAKITDVRTYVVTSIPNGTLTSSKFAAGAVNSAAIAPDAVMASHIAANAVGPSEIASGAVSTDELADLSVTQAKHAAASVGTAQLIDANVTLAKLAPNSVDAGKIVDLSVGTSELAASAVTDAKVATGISGSKISTNSIPADRIIGGVGSTGNQTVTVKDNGIGVKTNPNEFNFRSSAFTVVGYTDGTAGVDIDVDTTPPDGSVTNAKLASGIDAAKLTTGKIPESALPGTQQTWQTMSGFTTTRATQNFGNGSNASGMANALGTLIADLRARGILG